MLNIGIDCKTAKVAVAVVGEIRVDALFSEYFDRLKEEFENNEVLNNFVDKRKDYFKGIYNRNNSEDYAIEKTIYCIVAEIRFDTVFSIICKIMSELENEICYPGYIIRKITDDGDKTLVVAAGVVLDD